MRFLIRECFLVGTFLVLSCLGSAQDAQIRVATYNIENYLVTDRQVGARWRPAYPKPENEKFMVRQVICEIAPDILILQEMGTVGFLEELRMDLADDGVDYPYSIHMSGQDPDRHLAILSKIPPKQVVKHKDLDFKYFNDRQVVKRGMLEASFDLRDGSIFQLFAVHLKSRHTKNKEDPLSNILRSREAEACRNRIIERTQDRGNGLYMVAGDFNDHPKSAAFRRFFYRGKYEIGSLVPARDSRDEVWTYFYEKESRYELIDGFVASPAMLQHVRTGSGQIADTPGILTASDHRMVYVDLVDAHESALEAVRN